MKWTRIRTSTGELNDLIRSMMGELDPDAPLEQRIATYGKVISGLLHVTGTGSTRSKRRSSRLAEKLNQLESQRD